MLLTRRADAAQKACGAVLLCAVPVMSFCSLVLSYTCDKWGQTLAEEFGKTVGQGMQTLSSHKNVKSPEFVNNCFGMVVKNL